MLTGEVPLVPRSAPASTQRPQWQWQSRQTEGLDRLPLRLARAVAVTVEAGCFCAGCAVSELVAPELSAKLEEVSAEKCDSLPGPMSVRRARFYWNTWKRGWASNEKTKKTAPIGPFEAIFLLVLNLAPQFPTRTFFQHAQTLAGLLPEKYKLSTFSHPEAFSSFLSSPHPQKFNSKITSTVSRQSDRQDVLNHPLPPLFLSPQSKLRLRTPTHQSPLNLLVQLTSRST